MKTYKWTDQQKKALRGSIRKWINICNGIGTDDGADNCPCCKIWFDDGCDGCPIKEFTGYPDCDNTPYGATLNLEDEFELENANKAQLNFIRAVYLAGGGK